MRWEEVKQIHQAPGSVYVPEGRLVSLIATSDCWYGNEITRDRVRYGIGAAARPEIIRAFEQALSIGNQFRLFCKRAPGDWEDLGAFRAVSVEQRTPPGRNYPVL
jgi:hypothetical protein